MDIKSLVIEFKKEDIISFSAKVTINKGYYSEFSSSVISTDIKSGLEKAFKQVRFYEKLSPEIVKKADRKGLSVQNYLEIDKMRIKKIDKIKAGGKK